MLHQVDDPLELPSSRFFRMAQRLPLRGGAVAHAFALTRQDAPPSAGRVEAAGVAQAEPLVDISEVVGVSGPNSRGLPWIEYRGAPTPT